MLPERSLFHIINESNRPKIQILLAFPFHSHHFRNVCGIRRAVAGAFGGNITGAEDCRGVLGATEEVREK